MNSQDALENIRKEMRMIQQDLDELEIIKECTIPNLRELILRLYYNEELGEYQEILDMVIANERKELENEKGN